ncbi:hypothetical protein GBF38_018803 [Scomber scombrus]|uniref:Uncharacterized protein n=1 Tax=Scomber scombrus TaxID=13677 RepID=A0AAV1N925_SCOSC
MEKNTVTRTFSIGAICSGTKAVQSDDFSTARRHSSAGIRALLWATSGAKSFGCSLGSDSQTSRDNIFPNILTPDSIPQFTIPSLSVQNGFKSLQNNRETKEDDAESGEGSRSSGTDQESSASVSPACSTHSSSILPSGNNLILSDRRAERSVSDPSTVRRRTSTLQREVSFPCSYTEAQHCLDPASRAALSLPHLPKVTTPYGFITLSQSPQMANEEALLCQAGLRRLNKDEEVARCLSKASGMRTVHLNSHPSGAKNRLSKDPTDSQTKGRLVKGELQASFPATASLSSSSAPRHPDGKLKRRFYNVIKKHFTSLH